MGERPRTPVSFLVVARVFSIVLVVYTGFLVARLVDGADTFRIIQTAVFVAMSVFWLWYGWWGLPRRSRNDATPPGS